MEFLLSPRLRQGLRIALPTAVACDTIYSCWRVHQMARQRLQEWQEEDDEALRQEVVAKLQRLAGRCATTDRDFWPAALNARLGLPTAAAPQGPAAATADAAAVAAPAIEQQAAEPAAVAASVFVLLGLAAAVQEGAGGGETMLRAAAAPPPSSQQQQAPALPPPQQHQAPARGRSGVESVTLGDVLAHIADSRLAGALSRKQSEVGGMLAAWADGVKEAGQARLPWPQVRMRRVSALRCRLEWRGVSRPPGWSQPCPGLELELCEHC